MKVGPSGARTVPLWVVFPTWTHEANQKFDVSEEELVLGLRNVGREADGDLRLSMLRILIRHLIAESRK